MLPVGEGDGGILGWPVLRELAECAEAKGLDSIWVADHLLYQPPEGDAKGMHEAWTLMSALAAVTERVEIAPLVLCASFRNPGLVANMAATLDLVAGGRLTLGVGAGWHDPEYEAFGFPTDRKVSRFEEWVEILARLLRGERVTFEGRYYSAKDAKLTPAPERKIPLLVASHQPRMHGLTAKWADSWNTAWYGLPDDRFRERVDGMDAALAAAGRDPADLERTVGIITVARRARRGGPRGVPLVRGGDRRRARRVRAARLRPRDHLPAGPYGRLDRARRGGGRAQPRMTASTSSRLRSISS